MIICTIGIQKFRIANTKDAEALLVILSRAQPVDDIYADGRFYHPSPRTYDSASFDIAQDSQLISTEEAKAKRCALAKARTSAQEAEAA